MGKVDYFTGVCASCKASPVLSRVKAALSVVTHYHAMRRADQALKALEESLAASQARTRELTREVNRLKLRGMRYRRRPAR